MWNESARTAILMRSVLAKPSKAVGPDGLATNDLSQCYTHDMKPTEEQIKLANSWLENRIAGYIRGGYFVMMPVALRVAMKNGVDVSEMFAKRGIAPNGVQLLPNFFEVSLRIR